MDIVTREKLLKQLEINPFNGDIASDMYEKAMNYQMTGECECQYECYCDYHYGNDEEEISFTPTELFKEKNK